MKFHKISNHILYIIPFRKLIDSEYDDRGYMFPDSKSKYGHWDTDWQTKILIRETKMRLGFETRTSDWRQIQVILDREFIHTEMNDLIDQEVYSLLHPSQMRVHWSLMTDWSGLMNDCLCYNLILSDNSILLIGPLEIPLKTSLWTTTVHLTIHLFIHVHSRFSIASIVFPRPSSLTPPFWSRLHTIIWIISRKWLTVNDERLKIQMRKIFHSLWFTWKKMFTRGTYSSNYHWYQMERWYNYESHSNQRWMFWMSMWPNIWSKNKP